MENKNLINFAPLALVHESQMRWEIAIKIELKLKIFNNVLDHLKILDCRDIISIARFLLIPSVSV